MTDSVQLFADLEAAAAVTRGERPCPACDAVRGLAEPAKSALAGALAGTIGRDRLVEILSRHGYKIGRRTIERHRREDHHP